MTTRLTKMLGLACAGVLAAMLVRPAAADEPDCNQCHAALSQKKVVHPAVQIGCKACHGALDASTIPHKSTGTIRRGLTAEPPALCVTCHDAKMFEGKMVHAPVAAGLCTSCHDPHSSDLPSLALKPRAALCLECHGDVKKRPHVVIGFSGGGHPLGDGAKVVADPLREGKQFYCVACHEPHRSDLPRLARFPKGMGSCQKCHKM